jgi:hypothetical protein
MKYRSQQWFYGRDELGMQHRAALRNWASTLSDIGRAPVHRHRKLME